MNRNNDKVDSLNPKLIFSWLILLGYAVWLCEVLTSLVISRSRLLIAGVGGA